MKKLVLYHAHCNDGFGAALVAHRVYGKDADYVAVNHGEPPPKGTEGRDILLLDFAYPRQTLLELQEKATSLLVLDHHVTAQQDLEGLDWAVFDLEHSGAILTWKHFYPDEPSPWLLDYIEDRDLWNWKLPQSEAIAAALQSHPRRFETWEELIERGQPAMVAEGKPIVRFRHRLVEAAASRTRLVNFDGHQVPMVTSCVLQSEIGSRLAKKHPFVVIMFELEGKRVYSLRSHGKSGIDVSEIARRHGGGGHPNAAGFTVHLPKGEPLPEEPRPAR